MKITFLGAAGTVTGSKYLVENNVRERILIDCGMFQGLKQLRLRNWQDFPVNLKSINAVVLTHAHVDHCGYLPRLVSYGYDGPVYSTAATHALAEIILMDSARLQEEAAEHANRKKYTKHKKVLPLYTEEDADKALKLFRTQPLKEEFHIGNFKLKYYDAGHILGAASVVIEAGGTKVLFSGDIGRMNDLLMTSPHTPASADYIVMESTYGNRLHGNVDPLEKMQELLEQIYKNKSTLVIPSFAVGRAQTLLYCIYEVMQKCPHLEMPIYINSPMATEVTHLYEKFLDEHKLDAESCHKVCSKAKFVNSVQDSIALNEDQSGPKIIISASGMLTGGRVLHHLQAFGGDSNNVILLAGFQAMGTRGAHLRDGERSIKFFGYYHQIEAEVVNFDFFSAHADQAELISWLKSAESVPKQVILSHGEPSASDTLRRKIQDELDIDVHVAIDQETINL